MKLTLAVLLATIILGACTSTSHNASSEISVEEQNRRIAYEFYREGITTEERAAMISDNYIQHNPAALEFAQELGISNKAAFSLWMARLQENAANRPTPVGPQPPAGKRAHMVMAEDDLVFIMHQNFSQHPDKPTGEFYQHFTWGVFRITDGLISEHWDGNTIGAE